MNTFHYTAETTKDKIKLASMLEYNLRVLLKEIENDLKTEEQIKKIYDIQINLMKKWAGPSLKVSKCNPIFFKPKKINVMSLNEMEDALVNKLDSRKSSIFKQEMFDIGFGNKYLLHPVKDASEAPFDMLVFDKQTRQVIIKLGDNNKYKIVNAKLSNVYKQSENNFRSIICNNNVKSKNSYCYNKNCKYYHDPYIGSIENMHEDRQFANCPIVFNCPDFKSGSCVKKNTKSVDWIDSITLYQSSLCNLLIACIHSIST
jgi:ribosomal protein S8E